MISNSEHINKILTYNKCYFQVYLQVVYVYVVGFYSLDRTVIN